ncbi:hypothetical protein A2121_01130 [Candidatus Nomurabacteria bacterium GWB1_40_6]|uniref:Uncharacterized protein n=1 Tax=Candidatus Nomurabacteria bacterium GWB1_40_6 TaxID=1801727 RepID=A0A1F6TLU7_9BACT|nr:MAG: hypothetical protein A2121_01130 [Candidatus Nomurabacteria bacterium GWB1_40_6]
MKTKYVLLPIFVLLVVLGFAYFINFNQKEKNNMPNNLSSQQSIIEGLGFKKLTDLNNFEDVGQQEAVKAFITELQNIKENPEEFFIQFGNNVAISEITAQLVYQDSFKTENLYTIGNPSGKDRNATYNLDTKKVTFLLWK